MLLLEANHDIEMLKRGSYPYNLKQRILGDYGHMANINAGRLLAEIMSARIKHVFLGHLSAENNTPEIAYRSVEQVMFDNNIKVGKDINIQLARRNFPSQCLNF